MPYIKQEDRPQFDVILDQIAKINSKRELGYCIFRLMFIYMNGKEYKIVPGYFDIGNKKQFDDILGDINFGNKGQLEYCVYRLLLIFMKDKEYRYSNLHDAVYTAIDCGNVFRDACMPVIDLESFNSFLEEFKNTVYATIHAGEEFKRRKLDVREDEAIKTNGDII